MDSNHFLDLHHFSSDDLRAIIEDAKKIKSGAYLPNVQGSASHKPVLIMIFDKPSTRTRVSFDIAMRQIGGETLVLNSADMQLGRGETIADTAQVLSRYGDVIMLRTTDHQALQELAENAKIPVINGLTDKSHPCQILADILTFEEKCGPIANKTLAWIGDGNNVAASWMHAAARFGFRLNISCPETLSPAQELWDWAKNENANVHFVPQPDMAVQDADCVITDVWVSMGQSDAEQRCNLLRPFQVDGALMTKAKPDAIFMHCLPAHRGDEATAEVIDGPQSVVFDEAENRLHVQKAILNWCLCH
ncbi:MAG: ornithine carbamoyltransferase [Pseudomonadota bacterium]